MFLGFACCVDHARFSIQHTSAASSPPRFRSHILSSTSRREAHVDAAQNRLPTGVRSATVGQTRTDELVRLGCRVDGPSSSPRAASQDRNRLAQHWLGGPVDWLHESTVQPLSRFHLHPTTTSQLRLRQPSVTVYPRLLSSEPQTEGVTEPPVAVWR